MIPRGLTLAPARSSSGPSSLELVLELGQSWLELAPSRAVLALPLSLALALALQSSTAMPWLLALAQHQRRWPWP